jgi:arylsulfatase A-like enzyme
VTDALRRNFIDLYDAEIRYTDTILIRPVIQKLRELGLYENTLLIITSDHGEEFFEHGSWLHTHNLYNETIKVPLIIKFPGSRAAGTEVDRYARLVDIMPTILEEIGIKIGANEVDGRSLNGLMNRGKPGKERLYRSMLDSNILDNQIPRKITINQGMIKIILNDSYTPEMLAYFWVPPPKLERLEIYDLASDPEERLNLALTRPEMARRLLAYLEKNSTPTRKVTNQSSDAMDRIREELKSLGYIN